MKPMDSIKKNHGLVVKSNDLIQSSFRISEVAQKIFLVAIVNARKEVRTIEDLVGRKITITADDYCSYFPVKKSNVYAILKESTISLFEAEWCYKIIKKNGDIKTIRNRFVTSIEYTDNEGKIALVLSPDVIPMIIELDKRFTTYELKEISKLNSTYAIRIYELIMRFYDKKLFRGDFFITKDDLRWHLGLNESEYTIMYNFKKRVLDLSINQINLYTNLSVYYTTKKRGKEISGFEFHCTHKDAAQLVLDSNLIKQPLKLTDSQRRLLSTRLARLPQCQQLPGALESYEALSNFIFEDLKNPVRSDFYRALLRSVGFSEKNCS